jgi:hypothetical protein
VGARTVPCVTNKATWAKLQAASRIPNDQAPAAGNQLAVKLSFLRPPRVSVAREDSQIRFKLSSVVDNIHWHRSTRCEMKKQLSPANAPGER